MEKELSLSLKFKKPFLTPFPFPLVGRQDRWQKQLNSYHPQQGDLLDAHTAREW